MHLAAAVDGMTWGTAGSSRGAFGNLSRWPPASPQAQQQQAEAAASQINGRETRRVGESVQRQIEGCKKHLGHHFCWCIPFYLQAGIFTTLITSLAYDTANLSTSFESFGKTAEAAAIHHLYCQQEDPRVRRLPAAWPSCEFHRSQRDRSNHHHLAWLI